MNVGLIHPNLNSCGGRELVAISMLKCLKEMDLRTILLSNKRIARKTIMNYFGLDVKADKDVILPFEIRHFETYNNIFLPLIIKPFCEIIINAYTNSFLPFVDVTYFHSAGSPADEKRNSRLDFYHLPFHYLEKTLSFRTQKKLVLANSNFTAEMLRKNLGIRPKVIYPPVYTKRLHSAAVKERLIVTVGLFSPWKNLELIPEVASKIDAHFVIIGGLFDKDTYSRVLDLIKEKQVDDKVTIFTNAPLDVKLEFLQKAKVYFHTQPWEDFGISIIEGMAANCIPVVHDSGGAREYVPPEWRYKDAEGAIQKINKALDAPSSVSRKMKDISNDFSAERFQKEFSDVLKEYFLSRSFS